MKLKTGPLRVITQFITFVFLIALLFSCGEPEPEKKKPVEWDTEKSTRMNKAFAQDEDLEIQVYIAQHENWKDETTGSGLHYIRLKESEGPLAKSGQQAKVHYRVTLLDGTRIYETGKDEYDLFLIDKSEIETGIQEGIKKMRVGEKAKLIIPSHLAHGLIGDMDKVPPLTTLVVDIDLIALI